jgi:hypothetical protein
MHNISTQMPSIMFMLLIINALVHLIFAGAVAKDAGRLVKDGRPTYLVSPMTWAFATLVGGVFVAAVYWFMHHLNLMRNVRH